MSIFKIPSFNVPSFIIAINKLNKVCIKLNKEEVRITQVGTEIKKMDSGTGIEVVLFEVTGASPIIDGWSFRSLLSIEDSDKFIKSVPGFNLPSEYRTREVCDHCKITRNRNSYFFIENESTQEFKQVGSSCVKDFLGHSSPATIATWFEMINALSGFESTDDGEGSSKQFVMYDLDTAIQVCIDMIKTSGFISRKLSDETGQEPTSVWIHKFMVDLTNGKETYPKIDEVSIKSFIEFINSKDDSSDFIYNLKETVNNETGYVSPRKFGVLVAGVNMWIRSSEESKNSVPSEYFGNVGDKKVSLELTVVNVFAFSTQYGYSYTNIFKDSSSRVFVWKTTKGFEKGDVVKLVGTIKGHEEYKSTKQTILTRCKEI